MKPLCNSKIVAHHALQACRSCPFGAVLCRMQERGAAGIGPRVLRALELV